MTEVVINSCFGGFGLSQKGTEAYLARKGKKAWWFTDARDKQGRLKLKGEKVRLLDPDESVFMAYAYTSPDATEESYFSTHEIDRADPDLVAVVKDLGEAVNGNYARLKVVEIPDGTEWVIDEYDGLETVDEAHRSWS